MAKPRRGDQWLNPGGVTSGSVLREGADCWISNPGLSVGGPGPHGEQVGVVLRSSGRVPGGLWPTRASASAGTVSGGPRSKVFRLYLRDGGVPGAETRGTPSGPRGLPSATVPVSRSGTVPEL